MRRHPLAMSLLVALLLSACAPGRDFVSQGQRLIDQGRPEEGLTQIEKGLGLEPGNHEYRMLAIRQREAQSAALLARGDGERAAGRLDDALSSYRRAAAMQPGSARARAGIDEVEALLRERRRVDQPPADKAAVASAAPALRPGLRKPVTLEFRNADLKAVFEALSRTTGINFVFDREVKPDIKVTLSVANLTIEDVIGVLTITNQLDKKVLNDNTVLIYPNTPAKQKDYLELSVRTFYLANADAKSVMTMLKTVVKTKDLYADDKLNSLTIRDTPDALRLAEKLIASQDLAEPEVMLEVEVLEVKRSRLTEIGVDPPGKFTVLNIVPNPATVVSTATGATTVLNNTLTTTQLTLNQLRGLRGSSVGIDNPSLNLRQENGDADILANPRIRVKNRDKARILIGDRVPVITSTTTANVGVSESVSYLDVGLKLEVEPTIYLDNDVGVKVNLEVSNIVREISSKSGSLTYQIGTRMANTTLRLKDGETQALAGLISDEDRKTAAGFPGFVDLPVVGRLFSSERNDHSKTEIILLVTPHVVRNLVPKTADRSERASGTETTVGAPSLRLQSGGRMAVAPNPVPVSGRPAAAAVPEPEPEPEPPPPATASSPPATGTAPGGAASAPARAES